MKLNKRVHLIFEDEYPEELKELLKKKSGHFIVYDVAFSESVSTPAKPLGLPEDCVSRKLGSFK